MVARDQAALGLEQIAERLQSLRKVMGLTQVAMCELAGCSTQEWNNWEKARKRIGVDNAIRVSTATGVSLDWIYLGDVRGLPYELATKIQARARPKAASRRRA